ncbi:hypothetical protein NX722_27290 [Endozoicomonas gorgoniicola]|uniref:Uncharacterized protein n=1 Tax=Endozoicomonas gorgoniicola TaxID=1234144 RepID=A0ABT3N3Q1_9GAMM|nr:hypothetical protein [Endozoicomonas gorgoniicola]MCW7556268.1 hypothetical protein [Endozoicomonas gorgoniicola]
MLKKHVLIIFLALSLLPSPVLSQSEIASLQRLLNGWIWLARIPSQQTGIQLESLIRTSVLATGSNTLMVRAIDFPGGSTAVGADIRQVSRLGWRLQPESTVRVYDYERGAGYLAHEGNYPSQHMALDSQSDLIQLASCLDSTRLSHAPLWLDGAHSFTGVLSGLLDTSFRRGLLTSLQSSSLFTSSITTSQHLGALSIYRPDQQPLNHMVYSRYGPSGDLRKLHPVTHQADNTTLMQFAATPHTGACSLFLSPMGIISTTLDSSGNTIMLISHSLAIAFQWFTGMCRPDEDCGNPATWDRDNRDRQVNSLPLPSWQY